MKDKLHKKMSKEENLLFCKPRKPIKIEFSKEKNNLM
jgi:hypothetical protein